MELEKQKEGISLLMQGCKLMNWVIAYPEDKEGLISHLVIGSEPVVMSIVAEGSDIYTIAIPPK